MGNMHPVGQDTTSKTSTAEQKISFETISNLYLSAMATQTTNGVPTGGGYPDLSVIANLYNSAAGDDGIINTKEELQDVLKKIEDATGKIDLFEFGEDGKNIDATASTDKRKVDENGVLFDGTCAVTGSKNCTCKVTDGFTDIGALFSSLANDTDEEISSSSMSDRYLSEEEEKTILSKYISTVNEKKGSNDKDLEVANFGLEESTSETINKLNQGQITDVSKLSNTEKDEIKSYLQSLLASGSLVEKMTLIYGDEETAKKVLGDLYPTSTETTETIGTITGSDGSKSSTI